MLHISIPLHILDSKTNFWGRAEPIDNTRHDYSAIRANMSSYHPLDVLWLNTMSDSIDQESTYNVTFLLTFRQHLQKERHQPDRNEAFEYLCNEETHCAPDHTYLLVPDEPPHQKLVISRLCRQKLCLDSSIFFYCIKPKWDMLPFEDELDADTRITVYFTEFNCR